MESAQTPINRENITITLTHSQFAYIQGFISCSVNMALQDGTTSAADLVFLGELQGKFDYFQLLKSGDACRHSAQSPDAVVQGGTNSIELLKEFLLDLGDYASFMPSEKWVNKVRALVSDSLVQGGK